MTKQQRKPAWWKLYAFVLLMITAPVLESFDGLPDWANEVATIGIIGLVFGTMILWMHANAHALWNEERNKFGLAEYRVEVISPQQSAEQSPNGVVVSDDKVQSEPQSTHYVLRHNEKGNFHAIRITPRDSDSLDNDIHYGSSVPLSGYRSRANRLSESGER
jgi:hypothetical protein